MTDFPPSHLQQRRRTVIRRIGMGLSALMVLTVLVIFGLIMRNERAHDEAACPFAAHGEKKLGDARVIEEVRSCLPEVEERRWLVERPDQARYELGRKRLGRNRFAQPGYAWSLSEDAAHRLVLHIQIDGKPSSEFREEDVQRGPAP